MHRATQPTTPPTVAGILKGVPLSDWSDATVDDVVAVRASVCSDGGGTPSRAFEILKDASTPHAARVSVNAEKFARARAAKNATSFAATLDAHVGGAPGGQETRVVTADVVTVAFCRPVVFVMQDAFAVLPSLRAPPPSAAAPALHAAADDTVVTNVVLKPTKPPAFAAV